ncbi:aminotransferase class V-fold PLP-dependent enzyme [Streptomonospora nanhaiensis]|uniref:Cysteine desulfurase/selenocysteine lyase n=1 Tax=Streptomonospora nanhaiensis TaxID=1323731 RepID=A0A853BPE4_9ACTN|nr:aminotransferase class V-fold PLP-dependent enzyme [Streptomonospora nanhaiensis]MBV2364043.1 aminotransferase class V-fold PLP-dependent enzyme [Streptomonospora nanhaiensis]MBX9388673.1 aminotransferase class V-fold PLP-dependent enzyme [Streptomonospora nanhaiensis]NYI97043.1 cysteine desulfurase/selenocysteine lyase [Streptomonospora nanhaiensis]
MTGRRTERQTERATDAAVELAAWQRPLRAQFPIIAGNPELAYLDSAATAQKPEAVLDAVRAYLTTANANAARGAYPWANATTDLVERVRERVKAFLGDPAPAASAVHFTGGTTEGLRTVARDWLTGHLRDGDEIVVPFADHRANLDPWLEARDLLARQGVRIAVRELPYQDSSGDYDYAALAAAVGPRTRFVAATHVHHVYGVDMNIDRLRRAVGPEPVICLDAAQSVGHLPVDVAALDVDFVAFSGHKALALPGTGAVWARQARGAPFTPGGWSGTPNTAGIASLEAALDWLEDAGPDRVRRWCTALTARLTDALRALDSYEVLGCRLSLAADSAVQHRVGLVAFRHRAISSGDLGFILFSRGFMVRTDSHCQAGAAESDGSVRVSVHVYNTVEEIDALAAALAELD